MVAREVLAARTTSGVGVVHAVDFEVHGPCGGFEGEVQFVGGLTPSGLVDWWFGDRYLQDTEDANFGK